MTNDRRTYKNWKLHFVETYLCRADAFKYSFFPIPFLKRNKLNLNLRSAKSYSSLIKYLLKSSRRNPSCLKIHNPLSLMLLKRLRLSLSHLKEYRLILILTVVSILHVLAALKWNQKNIFSCSATTYLIFVTKAFYMSMMMT